MVDKQILASALAICIALQQNKDAVLDEYLPKLDDELKTVEGHIFLKSLKNILATALRKRNYCLFRQLLLRYNLKLNELLDLAEESAGKQDFVNFLAFNICDRRLVGERKIVESFMKKYLKAVPNQELQTFVNEWSSLIARFARRGWLSETGWLLRIFLQQLWLKRDLKLLQIALWQLRLNIVMKCSYDGFNSMFKAYRTLFYAYLVVVDYAEARRNEALAEQWLQLVLRSMRDVVIQLARVQMLEVEEVFHQLCEVWRDDIKGDCVDAEKSAQPAWRRVGLNSNKMEFRVQKALQMVITYWSLTNPRSSKKQLEYMKDLMEPRKITPECKKILKRLS